jgi:hypothetical protein
MRHEIIGIGLVCLLAAGPVFAHHTRAALGTVDITQPVMAGGKMLSPGTYEIRDTGEHPTPLPGQSEDAQAYIEFIKDGSVMARDVAEVMSDHPRPVGTSGGTSRPRVERLRGDEFLRVSTFHNGGRYLIHLPIAK